MSQTNYIVLTGFVTAEPKLWHTKVTRTAVAHIRVGSTPRRLDRQTGEWRDGETSYYNVTCWRRLAENVTGSLRKGDMVLIRGKFRTRTWVDDQQHTRVELEIDADSVGHDMSFGWSHFNRGVHTPPGTAERLADGEAARQQLAPDAELPDDTEFPGGPDDYVEYGVNGDDGYDGYDAGAASALTEELGQPAGEPAPL